MTRSERYHKAKRIARAVDADFYDARQAYRAAKISGNVRASDIARSLCEALIWCRDRSHAHKRVARQSLRAAAKVAQ